MSYLDVHQVSPPPDYLEDFEKSSSNQAILEESQTIQQEVQEYQSESSAKSHDRLPASNGRMIHNPHISANAADEILVNNSNLASNAKDKMNTEDDDCTKPKHTEDAFKSELKAISIRKSLNNQVAMEECQTIESSATSHQYQMTCKQRRI